MHKSLYHFFPIFDHQIQCSALEGANPQIASKWPININHCSSFRHEADFPPTNMAVAIHSVIGGLTPTGPYSRIHPSLLPTRVSHGEEPRVMNYTTKLCKTLSDFSILVASVYQLKRFWQTRKVLDISIGLGDLQTQRSCSLLNASTAATRVSIDSDRL